MTRILTEAQVERKRRTNKDWAKANTEKRNRRSKEWNDNNKERRRQIKKKCREKHPDYPTKQREYIRDNFAAHLLYVARSRSKRSGLPFDLTKEWMEERLGPMRCEVTNVPLVIEQKGKGHTGPWTPSIDQLRPGEGYTKKNTQIVCWAYNAAKQKWDLETVKSMSRALLTTEGEIWQKVKRTSKGTGTRG